MITTTYFELVSVDTRVNSVKSPVSTLLPYFVIAALLNMSLHCRSVVSCNWKNFRSTGSGTLEVSPYEVYTTGNVNIFKNLIYYLLI